MVSVEDRVKLVHSESERLKQYLDHLHPDALSTFSACAGWTVGDVVAHLVWEAEFTLDIIPRGLQGDPSPTAGFPPAGTKNVQWIDKFFFRSAIARRESLRDELLPTFNTRHEELNHLMSGLGIQDWGKPCYHPNSVRPACDSITRHINELAIHGWDMRSGLEPSPHLSAELLPLLMERIRQQFRNPRSASFLLGSRLPARLRYRFEVTGAVPCGQDIVVEDDKCRMESAGGTQADATFQCDTETFVLLMNRRLALDAVIAH